MLPSFTFSVTIFALGVLASIKAPTDGLIPVQMRGVKPSILSLPSPDVKVETYFPLYRSRGTHSATYLGAARKSVHTPGLSPAFTHNQGISYYTPMQIGDKTFNFIFDTGSSDTWVVADDLKCFNSTTKDPLPVTSCNFGPGYTPGDEFDLLDNMNFNTWYGDGSFVDGLWGKVNVTLGGISVKSQIALVKDAGWDGDGISSGMIGLAYPSLGQAFSGTNLTNDTIENQLIYNPIFTEMYTQKLIRPVFSVGLNRHSSGANSGRPDGYLALGGLVPTQTQGKWASSPIQYVEIGPGYLDTILPYPQYQWYTITPDDFLFKGIEKVKCNSHAWVPLGDASNSSEVQVIIDTGATQIYLPTAMSDQLSALFSPPAVYDSFYGFYSLPCDAIAPSFAIKIDGVVFEVDKRDLIQDDETGRGTCMSGVNDGSTNAPYVVGDVFLKNVVVVFDVGATELRIGARKPY